MQGIIDARYRMLDVDETYRIVEAAMEEAKKKIPDGHVATYIPELSKVDPNQLGICIFRLDGEKISLGDYNTRFSFQSVSKLVSLATALELYGADNVFSKVGAEPSGEAFNSLVDLEQNSDRPYNPLINSGALAVCSMLVGDKSFEDMLKISRILCVDPDITFNQSVYDSEMSTCARNKSITYLLQSKGIIETDPEDTLELYTKMCALDVTAEGLAHFAKILASDGVCSLTGKRLLSSVNVRIIKTLMLTCGMYDGSGTFAIKVGIPSKSGVGGGVLSVSDKRAGIGVWGPSLDAKGNSIAGCELLRLIANKLRLNLFYDPEWDK